MSDAMNVAPGRERFEMKGGKEGEGLTSATGVYMGCVGVLFLPE